METQPTWLTASARGRRTTNADAVAYRDGVVALADGVGDAPDAALAALTAVSAAVEVPSSAGPAAALLAAQANIDGGDCVLVVAQPYAGGYHLAWVGDARAYAWDGQVLRQLTHDHTLAQYFRDRGQPVTRRMEHLVTASVRTATPDEFGLAVSGPVQLLLTTDGVHKTLTHQGMSAIMRHAPNPAEALVRAATRAGTTDNATAVVLVPGRTPATPLPTTPLPTAA